jgi:Glycosyltransferases, probably involved in cell wall biogenesis
MKPSESLTLISVIVPVHDREKRLERTLLTISGQSYRPIELILVDNNSQDGSLDCSLRFQENHQDPFFNVKVIQEPKTGANAARNAGLARATGEYVLFFDSDDIMYSDCLLNIAGKLMADNFPDVLAYSSYIRYSDGTLSRRPHIYSTKPADQLFTTVIPTHGLCIKRSFLPEIGPWDESLARWQDLEFGFRVLLKTKNLKWYFGNPLYEVVNHRNSISGSSYTADHEILYASLMRIRENIERQPEGKEKDSQRGALCYKICTIGAQIRKEGHEALGKNYLQKAIDLLPNPSRSGNILVLRFQFWYQGLGGRGFWRLARKLL